MNTIFKTGCDEKSRMIGLFREKAPKAESAFKGEHLKTTSEPDR